jgi:hypothetical protein
VREEGDWNTRPKYLRSTVVSPRLQLAFYPNRVTGGQSIQEFPE